MNDNLLRYQIRADQNVLEAFRMLNDFDQKDALTLFVTDEYGLILGTLTDGDIRRKLVEGYQLTDSVDRIMHKDFYFLQTDNISVKTIRDCKNKGIFLIPIIDKKGRIVDVVNLKKYKSYLPIDAVLMAGGKGERLRPITENIPKPLIKIKEKAIIDYNIDSLLSFGIKHVSVTVNYLKEQIEKHFSIPYNGISIQCIREPQYLGTIGSIKFIDKFYNDTVLVMNSDIFTNINYEDFYIHFCENEADMSVAAIPYSISVPYGVFELEGRCIQGVKEKPTYNYYANAGIYLIKKELLDLIPDDTFFNATDFIDYLLQANRKIVRFPITGYWIDIGKHEELIRAKDLAKHIF